MLRISIFQLLAAITALTWFAAQPQRAAAAETIKVGYSSSYVFDEDADSVTYWDQIKKEFEAAHPGVTLEL